MNNRGLNKDFEILGELVIYEYVCVFICLIMCVQKDMSKAMINMEEEVDFNEKLLERLVDIQQGADELRVKTIVDIVEALTPPQAVDFLLIATRLHLGLRVFGLMHDSIDE